jgi:hypothetical protein
MKEIKSASMMVFYADGSSESASFTPEEWMFIKKHIIEDALEFFVGVKEMTMQFPDNLMEEEDKEHISNIDQNTRVFEKFKNLSINVKGLVK